ncbi:phage tail assembly chaperone [Pseudomonas sp. E102]|uniref:phage tail assembly chaperone n=1 Tax=Pseudomonas sp. E102 TaxID=181579 RepID=UPI0040466680
MVINMWALIQDSVVHEVTEVDPAGRFHPDLMWKPCGEEISHGWRYDGEAFVEPVREGNSLAASERAWRDEKMHASEWLVTRHRDEQDLQQETTLTDAQFSELLIYRQSLRDWPQSPSFPDSQHRPVVLSWFASQTQ